MGGAVRRSTAVPTTGRPSRGRAYAGTARRRSSEASPRETAPPGATRRWSLEPPLPELAVERSRGTARRSGREGANSVLKPPPPTPGLARSPPDEDPALEELDPPSPEGRDTAVPELVPDGFGRAPWSPLGFEE